MDIFVLGILFTTETANTIHIKSKAEKGFLVFLRFVVFCFLYFEMDGPFQFCITTGIVGILFCILEWSIPVVDPDFHVPSDKAVVRI